MGFRLRLGLQTWANYNHGKECQKYTRRLTHRFLITQLKTATTYAMNLGHRARWEICVMRGWRHSEEEEVAPLQTRAASSMTSHRTSLDPQKNKKSNKMKRERWPGNNLATEKRGKSIGKPAIVPGNPWRLFLNANLSTWRSPNLAQAAKKYPLPAIKFNFYFNFHSIWFPTEFHNGLSIYLLSAKTPKIWASRKSQVARPSRMSGQIGDLCSLGFDVTPRDSHLLIVNWNRRQVRRSQLSPSLSPSSAAANPSPRESERLWKAGTGTGTGTVAMSLCQAATWWVSRVGAISSTFQHRRNFTAVITAATRREIKGVRRNLINLIKAVIAGPEVLINGWWRALSWIFVFP